MTKSELAALFVETGKRHHEAYIESDGVDVEWPLFYAGYLQARLWDSLGVVLTRSELIHVMVASDLAIQSAGADASWPEVYSDAVISFAAAKAAGS